MVFYSAIFSSSYPIFSITRHPAHPEIASPFAKTSQSEQARRFSRKTIPTEIAPFDFAQGAVSRWLSGAVVRFPQDSQRVYYLPEIALGTSKK
jgi:hypothetical protein